jgi:hypothetical protein
MIQDRKKKLQKVTTSQEFWSAFANCTDNIGDHLNNHLCVAAVPLSQQKTELRNV